MKQKIEIDDNEETVTCRLCGEQCKRIYGRHLKFAHNNITTNEYKEMFPCAPITSLKDKSKTSIKSGQHMKTEKYKQIFSIMNMGEKNPMHSSKRTELQRKQNSPYSEEYYKLRYPDMSEIDIKENISKFAKKSIKNRVSTNQKQYWIERGYTDEESIKKVSERQTTFSKEICIEKYGEEEGIKRWADRQDLWSSTLNGNGNLKIGYSKISQVLFDELKLIMGDKCEYATNGGEFKLKRDNNKGIWMYDFKFKNKIIEYHGDMFHGNPKIYEAGDNSHPFRKKITVKEMWDKDKEKSDFLITKGYDILVIWDSEYRKVSLEKKEILMKKCIDFLNN